MNDDDRKMSSVVVTSTKTGELLAYETFDAKWKAKGVLRVLRGWEGPNVAIRFTPPLPNWLRAEVAAQLGHSCHLPQGKEQ